MDIKYSEPLSRAWLRMNIMLFRPFDLGAWFVLGFSAFLASLSDGAGSGGGNVSNRITGDMDFEDIGGIASGLGDSARDFLDMGLGIGLLMLLAFGVIILVLLFLWLSSRGKFIFLDNLVHKRTEVTRPWGEFSAQGDSLFLWQVGYSVILLAVLGLCVLFGMSLFGPLMIGDVSWLITAPLAIMAGTIAFILFVTALYIDFFLTAFVVPIMHRERIGTMAAWSRFLTLFREHPGSFFLCGIFYLILSFFGMLAFIIGGLLTCCVGLLLVALPYVGSVVTLPLSVTLRYFTLDFLGQFGDEFRLLEPVVDGTDLTDLNNHRTVVGTEDVGQDGSTDEPGPESSGD